jgi:hypothetical protein
MFKIYFITLSLFFVSPAFAAGDGVIFDIQSPVLVNGKIATTDTPIHFGDDIITGSRGRISIRLAGNVYRVGTSSHLKLPETTKNFTLNFFFGSILAVFRHDTRKTVRTRTAVLGVRGTGLFLNIDKQQTYLCTCYGDVEFQDQENKNNIRHIHSEYHNIIALNHESRTFTSESMKGHQTSDLFELESEVERAPPATFKVEHERNNKVLP